MAETIRLDPQQSRGSLAPLAQCYLDALLAADRGAARRLIFDAVDDGESLQSIYLDVFQPALYEVGRRWEINEITVADEHFCTAATQLIMSELYPRIFEQPRCGRSLIAASVSGELHEIGIRMVCDLFEMNGWDAYYVGANTPADAVVSTAASRGMDVLGVSATMQQHVDRVAQLIEAVNRNPELSDLRIMVGGQPFNESPELWRQIGAHGCADRADHAVELAESWTSPPAA